MLAYQDTAKSLIRAVACGFETATTPAILSEPSNCFDQHESDFSVSLTIGAVMSSVRCAFCRRRS